jgi:hypothetical protein
MENQNYYIVRADRAGVFFGQVKSKTDTSVVMTNVRKIHYWEDAAAVEQISQDGVNQSTSRLTVVVPQMEIASPIQIIECSEKATENLKGCKEWKRY